VADNALGARRRTRQNRRKSTLYHLQAIICHVFSLLIFIILRLQSTKKQPQQQNVSTLIVLTNGSLPAMCSPSSFSYFFRLQLANQQQQQVSDLLSQNTQAIICHVLCMLIFIILRLQYAKQQQQQRRRHTSKVAYAVLLKGQ
jgi:uncharacterized membrane protein